MPLCWLYSTHNELCEITGMGLGGRYLSCISLQISYWCLKISKPDIHYFQGCKKLLVCSHLNILVFTLANISIVGANV